MAKKYIGIYMKRNLITAFVCAGIAFVPLLIVSMENNAVEKDLLIALIPFPVALCCFLISLLPCLGFQRMIGLQEKRYGTRLDDAEEIRLENGLYLSRNWLIAAGRVAIYKKHIQKLKQEFKVEKGGSVYRIRITVDGGRQYTVRCRSEANVKKIRNWFNKI